jgi:hypothetical protein
MAIDFPSNPTNGMVYGNWIYDSSITAWRNVNTDTGIGTLNAMGLKNVVPTSVIVNSGSATVNANGAITLSGGTGIKIAGCFTSTYKNYRVIIDWGKSSVNDNMFFAMMSGTTPATAGHSYQAITITSGTITFSQSGNTSFIHFGMTSSAYGAAADDTRYASAAIELHSPQLTSITTTTFQSGSETSTDLIHRTGSGKQFTVAPYDGIYFYTGGSVAFSATIQIFGYTN